MHELIPLHHDLVSSLKLYRDDVIAYAHRLFLQHDVSATEASAEHVQSSVLCVTSRCIVLLVSSAVNAVTSTSLTGGRTVSSSLLRFASSFCLCVISSISRGLSSLKVTLTLSLQSLISTELRVYPQTPLYCLWDFDTSYVHAFVCLFVCLFVLVAGYIFGGIKYGKCYMPTQINV